MLDTTKTNISATRPVAALVMNLSPDSDAAQNSTHAYKFVTSSTSMDEALFKRAVVQGAKNSELGAVAEASISTDKGVAAGQRSALGSLTHTSDAHAVTLFLKEFAAASAVKPAAQVDALLDQPKKATSTARSILQPKKKPAFTVLAGPQKLVAVDSTSKFSKALRSGVGANAKPVTFVNNYTHVLAGPKKVQQPTLMNGPAVWGQRQPARSASLRM